MLNPQTIAYTPTMIVQIKRKLSNPTINSHFSNAANVTLTSAKDFEIGSNAIENIQGRNSQECFMPETSEIEPVGNFNEVGNHPVRFWKTNKFQIIGGVLILITATVIYYEYHERKNAGK